MCQCQSGILWDRRLQIHFIERQIGARKPKSKPKINRDLTQHLFSCVQQTPKIHLTFSNNYTKNDQMLPVDETGENQRGQIQRTVHRTNVNEFR